MKIVLSKGEKVDVTHTDGSLICTAAVPPAYADKPLRMEDYVQPGEAPASNVEYLNQHIMRLTEEMCARDLRIEELQRDYNQVCRKYARDTDTMLDKYMQLQKEHARVCKERDAAVSRNYDLSDQLKLACIERDGARKLIRDGKVLKLGTKMRTVRIRKGK
jgi:hypothetical protein